MQMNWMQQCVGLVTAGAVLGVVSGCSRHDHTAEAADHAGHAHDESGEPRSAQITVFVEARVPEISVGRLAATKGMKLNRHIFRQATFIEVAIHNVKKALLEGIVLVIVVVALFLANFRASLITVLAIPLSLVAAILALRALGQTVNTMTLGGMAIAIGALVDDAVIDVEDVFRRLREDALRPAGHRKSAPAVVPAGIQRGLTHPDHQHPAGDGHAGITGAGAFGGRGPATASRGRERGPAHGPRRTR